MYSIIFIILVICEINVKGFDQNLDVLTELFFANLETNPRLLDDNDVGIESQNFIAKQIENYINLVTFKPTNSLKKKRSLSDELFLDFSGTLVLDNVEQISTLPIQFSEDFELFHHQNELYFVTLEFETKKLKIYHFNNNNNSIDLITTEPIDNGRKLSTISFENITLITASQHGNNTLNITSNLYEFVPNKLKKIQDLDLYNAKAIKFWKYHEDLFLGITHTNDKLLVIYRWIGKHFDPIQTIHLKKPISITPFQIRNHHFLAIGNFDKNNNSTFYSTILKYNHHNENYEFYQKIASNYCNGVTSFQIQKNNFRDYFLIFANLDENAKYTIVYKFVDDYFIPFQSLNVTSVKHWEPIENLNGTSILFGVSIYDGIKIFQYNGWSFVEITENFKNKFEKNIKLLRLVHINKTLNLLTVTDKNVKMYRLSFFQDNTIRDMKESLFNWCSNGTKLIETWEKDSIFDEVEERSRRADIEIDDIDKVRNKLENLTADIDNLKEEIVTTLYANTNKELERKILADEVIFKNDVFVKNIDTIEVNSININELFDNSINISQNIEVNNLIFNSLILENTTLPLRINDKSADDLIEITEDLSLNNLEATEIICENDLNVKKLNNIEIRKENILLIDDDQNITTPVQLDSSSIRSLKTTLLNDVALQNVNSTKDPIVKKIQNITIDNLLISGYINDIDLSVINKYALKRNGDQTITAPYAIKNLKTKNFKSNSNKFSELIRTDKGNNIINGELIFRNLKTKNIQIFESLNDIKVNDEGDLDILLKHPSKTQLVTGHKIFENLEVLNSIDLRCKINSDVLDKIKPVFSTNKTLTFKKNITIDSSVFIENFLKVDDIKAKNLSRGFLELSNSGLTLDTFEIFPNLKFVQQLNVDDIFIDNINGLRPEDIVINGTDELQEINELKIFNGDVSVTGFTETFKINDLDMNLFENNILLQNEDQNIIGKLHVENVETEDIVSKSTKFGGNFWNSTMTVTTNETVKGIATKEDLLINNIHADNILMRGFLNNINFTKTVKDAVKLSTNHDKINGTKVFTNLSIDYLKINKNSPLVNIGEIYNDTLEEIHLDDFVNLNKPLSIENIQINKNLNNISMNQIEETKINGDNDDHLIVDGIWNISELIIAGKTFIENGEINGINITELFENSIKIHDNVNFDSVTFDTLKATQKISLHGEIERVDFENVVIPDLDTPQIISESIFFDDNIQFEGTTDFNAEVNGLNLSRFCDIVLKPSQEFKNVTIEGNVMFVKSPRVNTLNSYKTSNIWKNAWFKNRPTILTNNLLFHSVTFIDDILTNEFENIDLEWIHHNYFSKSRDQNISTSLQFNNHVTFEKDVLTSNIILEGTVNGISLQKFVNTVLLDDYEQTFENGVYLEKCHAEDFKGDFKFNNLIVDNDIMQLNKLNVITGTKRFKKLDIENLIIDRNMKIQNITVNWLDKIILKNGHFYINGNVDMKNVSANQGLELLGMVNNFKIDKDHVLIRHLDQVITGKKVFRSDNTRNSLIFKSIKLKGSINNVELSNYIQDLVFKNKNNLVLTPIVFQNNITTHNMKIKKFFQGVNITKLLSNVTTFEVINNLVNSYSNLWSVIADLDYSLKRQAYFLHHYQIIQTIPTNLQFKVYNHNGKNKLMAVNFENNSTKLLIYDWNANQEKFIPTINFPYDSTNIVYMEQIFMGHYLYIEEPEGVATYLRPGREEFYSKRIMNQTKSTASFYLPNEKQDACTLFIYKDRILPRIYCEYDYQIKVLQDIPEKAASQATTITIDGTLYILIINEAVNGMDSSITTWSFNLSTNRFVPRHITYETNPNSISVISYYNRTFLAISSGYIENTMYFGKIIIKEFDEKLNQFTYFQHIEINSPKQVLFSILPSNELVLYATTDNPTQPLIVYRYEGLSGFQEIVIGSSFNKINYMNQFMGGTHDHFIAIQNNYEINIIRAIFKGERITDEI